MANCKSCQAPIVWVLTANGKRMPIDAKPFTAFASGIEGHKLGDGDTARTVTVHSSHFSTCPQADQHRKAPK